MSDINNKDTDGFLIKLNNNHIVFKIIIYVLMVLMIGGGLAAIVLNSLIPVNPQTTDENQIVKQFELPYIHIVTYLCISILGILIILYIISVIYNIKHRGASK